MGRKPRCSDVVVLVNMVGNASCVSAVCAIPSCRLFPAAAWIVRERSLAAIEQHDVYVGPRTAEECSDACLCERCLATPHGTVRAHIHILLHAFKLTSDCQRCAALMFELHGQSVVVVGLSDF